MTEFDSRVRQLRMEQLDDSTPCSEWTVRDLLNHLVSEQLWAPHLLRGETLDQVGDRYDADQLGHDPIAAWHESSAAARRAWDAADLSGSVHVTGGVIAAEEYGWQMTTDLAVHAWDLARGLNAQDTLDPELAHAVHEYVAPQSEAMAEIGIFSEPIAVSAEADVQTRMLAATGRRA